MGGVETWARKQPLIIVAGADYGQGSSRDWAAKACSWRASRRSSPGLRAHPSHQPGGHGRAAAGIQAGDAQDHAIDGTETFDVAGEPTPRAELTLVIHRSNGRLPRYR